MKTKKVLQSEIDEILSQMKYAKLEGTKSTKAAKKANGVIQKLRNKLSYLKTCMAYIESEPSIEFINKEKERLTNKINKTIDNYVPFEGYSEIERRRHKREYEKSMELSLTRKQLSTLNFISR